MEFAAKKRQRFERGRGEFEERGCSLWVIK
jgi:hypothetical protein